MNATTFRIIISAAFVLFVVGLGNSQRASPAKMATGTIDEAAITINYSAPSVKGRKIWGGLVPYNAVWRTGANEATTFETSADIEVAGESLSAGKYGVWTIPGEEEWTVIFNSAWDTWGTNYDEKTDVLRVTVPFATVQEMQEQMMFEVGDDAVMLKWEHGVVSIPID